MSDLIERAAELAERAHAGQTDKAGMPYIGHPARVAALVATRGGSDTAIAAAWLHDVVEDTNRTVADIEAQFGPAVAAIVDAVTRRRTDPTPAYYYARVRQAGADALLVKTADVDDNTDPGRLALLDPAVAVRLARKYAAARAHLSKPDITINITPPTTGHYR